jgi:hypothetical protein
MKTICCYWKISALVIVLLTIASVASAEDIIYERYHLVTPGMASYEDQAKWTMAAMTVLDVIQTANQKREINPFFYGKRMGTSRAMLLGLAGYMLFNAVNYFIRDKHKLRQIFQESAIYTEAVNVQSNSQLATKEMRTRNTLIFFVRIPWR